MTVQREIQEHIASFAVELEQLVRRAAIEAVSDALGQPSTRTATAAARSPVAGHAPTSISRTAAAPATKPTATPRRRKGGKRDPKEIDALTERTASFIKANAGKRVEEIGKALSTPTKELALPIIRLLANKTIKKSGQKRATKYYPR